MKTARFQTLMLSRARARFSRCRSKLEGQFIKVPGALVRIQTHEPAGSARGTLVLVPDPPNLIEHHASVVERLARDFRVICLELPGFGYSHPQVGFAYALQAQVAALAAVLDQLRVRDAILEMSCLGAFAGMTLAQQRPDLIGRLLLLQVPSYSEARRWARRADVAGLIATPWLGQILVQLAAIPIARHWYQAALPAGTDSETYRRFTDLTLQSLRQGACFTLASAYQTLLAGPLAAPFALNQPVVALWGDSDETHALTERSSILQQVPGARLETFKGCGHFPSLEKPEAYISLLFDLVET